MQSLSLAALAVAALGTVGLGLPTSANAAVLFTKSGTIQPGEADFFEVPEFAYNIPLKIKLKLSRTLGAGESLSFDFDQSTTYYLYWDGDVIDYDYYMFLDQNPIQFISSAVFDIMNYYSYSSWYEDDWDGPHFVEREEYVTLEAIWFDDVVVNSPFQWTVTISGAVPEPASWALMIAGFGLVGVMLRRAKVPAPS